MNTEIKIGVVGRKQSGKSTYIKRITTSQFISEYVPTIGLQSTILQQKFVINDKVVTINITLVEDTKIVQKYDVIMIFIDEDESPLENFDYFISLPKPSVPTIICSTKGDIKSRAWYGGNKKDGVVAFLCHKKGYYVYQISSRSNYNLEKPILHLVRKVLKDENIVYS